ncbi:ANTAR domain-containing protein [Pseudonocardia alni]|uniref:ANTAR domain-containing protein n=1 Tax=Pseudonocardia alni TaxID=33907 RepID=UPI001AD62923|nr:ANTAR domain-containing protein [Pseudonocardia alni]MBO4239803.1 ANTAR domain-containing protein [Pseudonocardia alni]
MVSSSCAEVLRACQEDPVFHATAAPYLVLDRELRIVSANRAYCTATLREPEELVGMDMFEAFPDNPALPDADGVANLGASIQRVLRHHRPDQMHAQRYDVPVADRPGGFVERVWLPVNTPIPASGDTVTGVLHHVEDITALTHRLQAIAAPDTDGEQHRGPALDRAPARTPEESGEAGFYALTARLHQDNLRLEKQFQRRACIEQAKGILIGARHCNPDDAFAILRRISQETNTKLHKVAQALIDTAVDADPP